MILKKKEITLLLDFRENLLREKEQDILHISYLKKNQYATNCVKKETHRKQQQQQQQQHHQQQKQH